MSNSKLRFGMTLFVIFATVTYYKLSGIPGKRLCEYLRRFNRI